MLCRRHSAGIAKRGAEMDLQYLKYYVAIISSRSINSAARKLDISRSSLMAALNSMENEIGEILTIRSQNGISPTEKGEKIYHDACQILGITQSWKKSKQQDNDIIHIKVDIAPMFEHTFFEGILNELSGLYPNLAFYTNVVSVTAKDFPIF